MRLTENLLKEDWESLLERSKYTTPFQTPAFFSLCRETPGFEPFVYAVDDQNEILALCVVVIQQEKGLKGFFSRRAIVYGGPVLAGKLEDGVALELLLKAIQRELSGKAIYAETRNFNDYEEYRVVFDKCGWKFLPYLDYVIPLKNRTLDEVMSSMKYNRRREIQQTIKRDVHAGLAASGKEVGQFYQLLTDLYASRVRLPLPPLEFFMGLYRSDIAKIFVVRNNNAIIGGACCLCYPGKGMYSMYYCGLRNIQPGIFPTHLAVYAAIEWGIQEHFSFLDLMGAGKPEKEYGVRNYKAGFGGNETAYGRYILVFKPMLYAIGKTAVSLMKKKRK